MPNTSFAWLLSSYLFLTSLVASELSNSPSIPYDQNLFEGQMSQPILNQDQKDLELLFKDSREAAAKISSLVERNKLLKFLNELQVQTARLIEGPLSSTNRFLVDFQQEQWQQIVNRLQKRLDSGKQNLPDGVDKELITRILTAFHEYSLKKLPQDRKQNVMAKSENFPSFTQVNAWKLTLDQEKWLKNKLAELKPVLGSFSPSVFISYAWGPSEQAFTHQLADYLKLAGLQVRLDIWHNNLSTAIQTGFVDEIENVDYIVVVGSKLYGDKCRQGKNNVVAAEARIIAERHKRQPGRILPILFSGLPREAFPSFLRDKVFVIFNQPDQCVKGLSRLILTMCKYADNYDEIEAYLQRLQNEAAESRSL